MTLTPFDITYRALIAGVTAKSLVRPGNFIKFDEVVHRPEKPGIASADVPELVLYMSGFSGNLHQSTSTARLTTTWTIVQSSGSYDSQLTNAVNWALIGLLADWQTVLHPLKYNDRVFVQDCRLAGSNSGQDANDKMRNIRGWVTVSSFEIDMSFLTADVVEYLP